MVWNMGQCQVRSLGNSLVHYLSVSDRGGGEGVCERWLDERKICFIIFLFFAVEEKACFILFVLF